MRVLEDNEVVDFVVEVESGRDPIILQLTDIQIIDSAQARTPQRISAEEIARWATDTMDVNCFHYVREIIEAVKPDLILLTGDNVYGEFDDDGTALLAVVRFVESFGIPWAPVFGNHDAESKKGVDWQCQQYENAKHCLFKQRELTGNGNYAVGIKQDGKLKRVFFMLDTNGARGVSEESLVNGHTLPATATVGLRKDQIIWYTQQIQRIKENSPNTKFSVAFHFYPAAFQKIYEKYGHVSGMEQGPLLIDELADKEKGDFGCIREEIYPSWDIDYEVWNGWKNLGIDSVFVGHNHINNASVIIEGIRCQYGTKSSIYDYHRKDMIGGVVIPLSHEDGTIKSPYTYIVEN